MIRRMPFLHLVREIVHDYIEGTCIKPKAINALHYIAESYLVRIFEDTYLIAWHAKRIIVYPKGISLEQCIPGEIE